MVAEVMTNCPLHEDNTLPCDICTGLDEYAPANDYGWCGHGVADWAFCNRCDIEGCNAALIPHKVTGSNNPHYDFSRPVNGLQELVDVLDPNMDYRRYNILKSVIRWKEDEEYNYQKISYYSNPGVREMSSEKEGR